MNVFLVALSVSGVAGLSVGAFKMFSIPFPPELRPFRYPLKAKEAILRSLHSVSLSEKLDHISKAKSICARKYGEISPQFTNLLCFEASVVDAMGDCQDILRMVQCVVKKPHVGEAIAEEATRWTAAVNLLESMKGKCADEYCQNRDAILTRMPKQIAERMTTTNKND